MTVRAPRQSIPMRLTGLVLVVPFMLLSLLAPGYMPQRSADGALTLVICSDQGAVELRVDPATGEPLSQQAPEDDRCHWAQAGMAALITATPAVALPPATLVPLTPTAPDDLWRPAFDPRGLFARGPPATV